MTTDICAVIAGLQQNADTMREHLASGHPSLNDLIWYWPGSGLSCRYVGDTCNVVACHPSSATAAARGDIPLINGAGVRGVLWNRADAIRHTLGSIKDMIAYLQAR